ncbi:unnamed protein product [Ceutorhynchus assimilis]|uniref:Lipase n=1 Tax=Ceutorhynchus assimilis TaxID=467358 RepID=A0A9N9MH40_9CUCU|nr:unnamed protein product [Ceutorhynchus assimilis]
MNYLLFFGLVFLVATNANAGNLQNDVAAGSNIHTFLQLIWDLLKILAHTIHIDEDAGLNITQFLEKYNYSLEQHQVTTEDNYILSLHRIPHGRNNTGTKNKPVVLLVHCLACSSMDWIWPGPNKALALLLADLGYDVWLANNRGNSYSMGHKTLIPKNASYWDFSFYEKGYYDIPASIDHILNVTGVEKITYIGHSQGATTGIVLTTTRPEYNDKINLMTLLSPVAYLGNATSPMAKILSKYQSLLDLALPFLGIHGIAYTPTIGVLGSLLCNQQSSLQPLCIVFIDLFAGFDADQVDKEKLPVFLSNTPNGVSIKDIKHYVQEMDSGHFRRFDYGKVANIVHYGQLTPPAFNVSKITAPLAVYYAKNDFMVSLNDVTRFVNELSTFPKVLHQVEYDFFNHLDFITAKDVKSLLYDSLIETIQKYAPVN